MYIPLSFMRYIASNDLLLACAMTAQNDRTSQAPLGGKLDTDPAHLDAPFHDGYQGPGAVNVSPIEPPTSSFSQVRDMV